MLSSIVDLSHHTTNTSWPNWHDVDVQHVLKNYDTNFVTVMPSILPTFYTDIVYRSG